MTAVVGVLAQPLTADAAVGRYRRAVAWKANPRTPEYMRALLAEAAPGGVVAEASPGLRETLCGAETVILLYPDAIGLGWEGVERAVLAAAPPGARIEVLNGRRRRFAFDASARRALRARRVLERTMLVEALAAPVIIGLAPVLWLVDAVRGRR
jgi:hypothetical protein